MHGLLVSDAHPEHGAGDPVLPPPSGGQGLGRRVLGFFIRNAYLALLVGAVMVLTRVVDFEAPDQVRSDSAAQADLIGDAPQQEFSTDLGSAQAVQVRATVRRYGDTSTPVGPPDPEIDDRAQVLSQPVVTTILGMNATVDQTIRLEDGALQVDLVVHATPRLEEQTRKGKAPKLTLEHEISVSSRRTEWWSKRERERIHIDSRGTLLDVEDKGYRLVFTVDDHLFALDLELNRPYG